MGMLIRLLEAAYGPTTLTLATPKRLHARMSSGLGAEDGASEVIP
jgi:hypothetical protein